ncbi:hypothetical protein D9M68_938320 [compost metagenome]
MRGGMWTDDGTRSSEMQVPEPPGGCRITKSSSGSCRGSKPRAACQKAIWAGRSSTRITIEPMLSIRPSYTDEKWPATLRGSVPPLGWQLRTLPAGRADLPRADGAVGEP